VSAANEAQRLMKLSDDELSQAAERQSHSILGRVNVEAGRNLFPLTIESPRAFASHRVALVGESAHVLPPIGAQGLNMGLRDAVDIADIAGKAMSLGEDPGSPQVLALPDGSARRRREPDDCHHIANRSLLSDFLPMQSLRAAGLHPDPAVRSAPSVRHARRPRAVLEARELRKHQPTALDEPHHAGQRDDGCEQEEVHPGETGFGQPFGFAAGKTNEDQAEIGNWKIEDIGHAGSVFSSTFS
jgi:2-polyprenyl-6-methoxyphenol hydroxylase-like FAD-dependent oxidoreductase